MTAVKQPGFKDKLYHDSAGSTAATQLLRITDLDIDATTTFAEVTDRGDGSAVPHEDQTPVKIAVKITFKFNEKTADPGLPLLLAAQGTSTPRAFKYANALGTTMFDGDCYVKSKKNAPLGGAGTYDFELTPTEDGGRVWAYYGS